MGQKGPASRPGRSTGCQLGEHGCAACTAVRAAGHRRDSRFRVGIKNAAGDYIAALCLNLDVSVLSPVTLTTACRSTTDRPSLDRARGIR